MLLLLPRALSSLDAESLPPAAIALLIPAAAHGTAREQFLQVRLAAAPRCCFTCSSCGNNPRRPDDSLVLQVVHEAKHLQSSSR
ncbi:unnamed protein product [Sphagnum troendelagicum]